MTTEAYEESSIDTDGAQDFGSVDFFAKIKTKYEDRPVGGIIYGEPGSGKSSLAAQFPGALFVTGPRDRGIETLKQFKQVPADTASLAVSCHDELLAFLQYLLDQDEIPYKYLILDQFSEFQQFIFEYVCREEFNDDWSASGFYNYQQGYDRSPSYLMEVLDYLEALRDRGVGVFVLAHSVVKAETHPVLGAFDRYIIDAHHKMVAALKKWADTILFVDYVTETVEPEKGKAGKVRGKGGKVRVVRTTRTAAYDAKNRFGLTEDIMATQPTAASLYAALVKAMKEAKKGSN